MRLPKTPPTLDEMLSRTSLERLARILATALNHPEGLTDRYYHWDKLRRVPAPLGLSSEEWWLALKMGRAQTAKPLPLLDSQGRPFRLSRPDAVLEVLPRIDSKTRGAIIMPEKVTNADTRDRYLVSSLIEEALTSSQLEGAVTTTRVARDMLRSGRKPCTVSERMILNNFEAMECLREWDDQDLSPRLILELHAILTEGTLADVPDAYGRLRRADEEIVISRDGIVLHEPPPADQLEERLLALCEFANERTPAYFIHPVVRAILVHFWLAYDHPFVDGNGRTARALFYWAMQRYGYWMCQFLSISKILRGRATVSV